MRVMSIWPWLLLLVIAAGCSGSTTMDGGTPCTVDDECGIGQYCNNGVCTPFGGDKGPTSCLSDDECAEGWWCNQGICTPGSRPDGGDGTDAGDAGGDSGGDADAGGDQIQPEPQISFTGDVIIHQDQQGKTYEINFGSVSFGTPVEADLVIRNLGEADLVVSVVTITDDANGEFGIAPEVPPEVVLEPGEETTLLVTYTAADGLTDRAVARVFSNDPDEGQIDINLVSEFKGEAVLHVDPAVLDYGTVALGQPLEKSLSLSNQGTGNAVLRIDSVEPEPALAAAYALQLEDAAGAAVNLPAYLNRGDALTARVTFLAPSRGSFDGNLVVTSSDEASGVVTVTLQASCGLPLIEVEPGSIDFGGVATGESAVQTITVRNKGVGPLTVSAIELASGSSPDFVLENLPAPLPAQQLVIDPEAAASFDVRYSPLEVANDMGTVLIDHDDPEPGQQFQLLLAGVGFQGNEPPVARILANGQEVERLDVMLGDVVTFDGRQSHDNDGSVTGYLWEVLDRPPVTTCGPAVSLPTPDNSTTLVTMSEAGLLRFGLTVTDDDGAQSSTDTIDVMVHAAPSALIKAGGNDTGFMSVDLGTEVTFDALLASDCDGNITSYQWQFTGFPAGRGAAPAIGGGQQYATVTFDFPGDYQLGLVVGDDDNPQNLSPQATFDIHVRGPKAFRLTLDVFDLGNEDHHVDIDMHLMKPGSGSTDIGTPDDCCPDKDGVDTCYPNPDWGVYGSPNYNFDVFEDPDGAPLPNPGNPQDEIVMVAPGLGEYKLYVFFRCHSSTSWSGYICCENLDSNFFICPWTPTCTGADEFNKCERVGHGVIRFFITGYDDQEQEITQKNFAFPADASGDIIEIGTVRWPQGTLQ